MCECECVHQTTVGHKFVICNFIYDIIEYLLFYGVHVQLQYSVFFQVNTTVSTSKI